MSVFVLVKHNSNSLETLSSDCFLDTFFSSSRGNDCFSRSFNYIFGLKSEIIVKRKFNISRITTLVIFSS